MLDPSSFDIELGSSSEFPQPPLSPSRSPVTKCLYSMRLWWRATKHPQDSKTQKKMQSLSQEFQPLVLEDNPLGYPRFSALMASHDGFLIFRRFSNLRTRLLLLAQDRVAQLERKLDRIDREESAPLFLACSRRDGNTARQAVLSETQVALAVYDDLVQRNSRMVVLDKPHPLHVRSLQNWLAGNACIARDEAEFLRCQNDLASFSRPDDVVSWLARLLSSLLRCLQIRTRSQRKVSRDERVHILSRAFTDRTTRLIIAPVVTLLVLLPVIVCNVLNSLNARLAVVIVATNIFVMLLSLLTKSKTIELAVAGATYATVLVVFISGPTGSSN